MKKTRKIMATWAVVSVLAMFIALNARHAFNDNSVQTNILQAEAVANATACVDIDFSDGAVSKPYQTMMYCNNVLSYACRALLTDEFCIHKCQ